MRDLIMLIHKLRRPFALWGSICLLATSLLAHVHAQCIDPPPGLVSWWTAEEDANDVLGRNHGEPVNGAAFTRGKVGQAFQLNGAKDYVLVADSESLNITGDLTLDAWLNLSSSNGEQESPPAADRTIIDKRNDANTMVTYSFFIEGDTSSAETAKAPLRFLVKSPEKSVASSHSIKWEPDTWYHVAAVKSDDTVTFYRDGVVAGKEVLAAPSAPTPGSSLAIGASPLARGVSFPIRGLLDEVAIFNRALSAAEIKAIFKAGRAGKCR